MCSVKVNWLNYCVTPSSRSSPPKTVPTPSLSSAHGRRDLRSHSVGRRLTSREPVPHFQPVVLAVPLSAWQGVVLQVKGEEGEGHVHAGGDDDDEGALQVVGVFVGEARGLDETRGAGEVTGTV